MNKIGAFFFWLVSAWILFYAIADAWTLRDGFALAGPAVGSHGVESWEHFWDGGGVLILLIFPMPTFLIGCGLYPGPLKKKAIWRLTASTT